ncbi:glycosyltransferase family 2 protein [Psychromonas sp. PT13]|uniref:glycosyltransferase family 2 protein n=1 Tax=Psychromonas sp. PT13 TaxID=3439547 RepID=UPI003EBB2A7A
MIALEIKLRVYSGKLNCIYTQKFSRNKIIIYLDEKFSTTRLLSKRRQICEYKIEDKFRSVLFLPENNHRIGEGGLRTKDHYKHSYKDKPLISIVTIVYNGEMHLKETILSVLNQDYDNVEYIIIDGGSTDGTLGIVKKYEGQIDYWASEPDKGISDAFNKGLRLATGDYVLMLNSGDSFLDKYSLADMVTKIGADITAFQSQTDTGNVFPDYQLKDIAISSDQMSPEEKFKNARPAHQATLVKLSLYKKVGGYSLDYKIRMDFKFFLSAQKNSPTTCYNIAVIHFRTDGISSSIKNQIKFKQEELKAIRSEYQVNTKFLMKFYFTIPSYLLKKLLSHFYYKYKRA